MKCIGVNLLEVPLQPLGLRLTKMHSRLRRSNLLELIVLIHFFCCVFMTGLIWLVQRVHYPSFQYVNLEQSIEFALFHQKMISFVVIPVMLTELGSGLYLVFAQDGVSFFFLVNLILLGLIWVSTFYLSVPLHEKLLQKFDRVVIDKLVKTNWPRTLLWTLRSLMISFFLVENFARV